MLPVDGVDVAAPPQPALGAHSHLGHHPVPAAGLFDAEVDDDDVDAGQLAQVRVVDADPGFEHLAQDEDLAGPLSEAAQ